MGLTASGWFDWAERVPGPEWKTNGGRNGLHSLVGHSAEGWEDYLRNYQSDGNTRRASWHMSNLRSGVLLQHYSIFAQTWASGAGWPNANGVAIENEGIAGMPLTEPQISNLTTIIRDLAAVAGRPKIVRLTSEITGPAGTLLLTEHTQCTRWGADATECPSGRIPWAEILRRLEATKDEEDELMKVHTVEDGWFKGDGEGRHYDPGQYAFNARAGFALPPEARLVKFAVYVNAGRARFEHEDHRWAEEVGFDGGRYQTIEAYMNGDGWLPFEVITHTHFHRVISLGYW